MVNETRHRPGLTPKGERTRARIVAAAAALIYERGVAGTTFEEVRTAAEVSGSQLSHYFAGKDELVQAVIDHQADIVVGNQEEADLGTTEGIKAWRDMVIAAARDTGGKGGCPLGSLGGQLAETDPEARALIAAGFARWSAAIGDGLRALQAAGHLPAAAGSPFPAQGLGPFGSQFRPTNPSQLFVSNAHNGTGLGTVSAFSDSRTGVLTPVGSSPVPDEQTAPCWVTISPDGRYLFAVNTGSGTISRYSIAPGGALTLVGSTQVAANGGVGAVDPGLSPDGRFLFVNESKIASVGAFAVSGGNLTELPGSPTPLPAGATPAGIAVS